jgi:hypothetical protein
MLRIPEVSSRHSSTITVPSEIASEQPKSTKSRVSFTKIPRLNVWTVIQKLSLKKKKMKRICASFSRGLLPGHSFQLQARNQFPFFGLGNLCLENHLPVAPDAFPCIKLDMLHSLINRV